MAFEKVHRLAGQVFNHACASSLGSRGVAQRWVSAALQSHAEAEWQETQAPGAVVADSRSQSGPVCSGDTDPDGSAEPRGKILSSKYTAQRGAARRGTQQSDKPARSPTYAVCSTRGT